MDAIWNNPKEFVKLAKVDGSETDVKKTIKRFMKECFKSSNNGEESVLHSNETGNECIEHLNKFAKVMSLLEKKGHATFVEYALELMLQNDEVNEIMLDKKHRSNNIRPVVIVLFCQLCQNRIEFCVEQKQYFVEHLLSVYHASMSVEDQNLLRLLSQIESAGFSLQRYRPFIWGQNGAQFYRAKQEQKLAFLSIPSIDEIFNDFNDNRLQYSLTNFPIEVELGEAPVSILDVEHYRVKDQYDPRFLLPTFYHLMSADSIVKCHKFIAYGGLAYTIVALSSLCPRMRSLAYRVLARFYEHLEAANYPKERKLWLGLLDHLRSGLTEPDQRLESLHTMFFINIIEVLHRPLSKLFPFVRNYLLTSQKEAYNYRSLPSLYWACLHQVTTKNENYAKFQKFAFFWILNSLRTDRDVRLCHYRGVFSDLLTQYGSPLSAPECGPLILMILSRAASLYEGVKTLCFDCAIFCWMKHQLQQKEAPRDELLKLVITLWQCAYNNHRTHKPDQAYVLYRSFALEMVNILALIIRDVDDVARIGQYCSIVEQAIDVTKDEFVRKQLQIAVLTVLPRQLDDYHGHFTPIDADDQTL